MLELLFTSAYDRVRHSAVVVDINTISSKSEKKSKCKLRDDCQERFVKELELSLLSINGGDKVKGREGRERTFQEIMEV